MPSMSIDRQLWAVFSPILHRNGTEKRNKGVHRFTRQWPVRPRRLLRPRATPGSFVASHFYCEMQRVSIVPFYFVYQILPFHSTSDQKRHQRIRVPIAGLCGTDAILSCFFMRLQ